MKKKLITIAILIFIVACSKDNDNTTKTQAYITLKQNNADIEEYNGVTYHDNFFDPTTSYLTTIFRGKRINSEKDTDVNFIICYGQDSPIVRNFEYFVGTDMGNNFKLFIEDESHVLNWTITENGFDGFKATYSGSLINNYFEIEEITVQGTVFIKYGRPYAEDPNPKI